MVSINDKVEVAEKLLKFAVNDEGGTRINQALQNDEIELMDVLTLLEIYEDPKKIYFTVKNVPALGDYVYELAEIVIKSKEEEYIYRFARDIANAPVFNLARALVDICLEKQRKTKNAEAYYMGEFLKDVKNAPVSILIDGIATNNDAITIYSVAFSYNRNKKFTPELVKKLAQGIIASKDPSYMFYFARDIINAPIDSLARAIFKTKSTLHIYFMATLKKGSISLSEYAKELIKNTKTPESTRHLLMFSQDFHQELSSDTIIEITQTICDFGEPLTIINYMRDIPGIDYDFIFTTLENIYKGNRQGWIDQLIKLSLDDKPYNITAINILTELRAASSLHYISLQSTSEECKQLASDNVYNYNEGIKNRIAKYRRSNNSLELLQFAKELIATGAYKMLIKFIQEVPNAPTTDIIDCLLFTPEEDKETVTTCLRFLASDEASYAEVAKRGLEILEGTFGQHPSVPSV